MWINLIKLVETRQAFIDLFGDRELLKRTPLSPPRPENVAEVHTFRGRIPWGSGNSAWTHMKNRFENMLPSQW
jgi:hypothetical protein